MDIFSDGGDWHYFYVTMMCHLSRMPVLCMIYVDYFHLAAFLPTFVLVCSLGLVTTVFNYRFYLPAAFHYHFPSSSGFWVILRCSNGVVCPLFCKIGPRATNAKSARFTCDVF